MAKRDLLPVERLAEVLVYDRNTGILTWLPRKIDDFPSARTQKIWNARFAGKPALTSARHNGYRTGSVDKIYFYAHRVCWALMNKAWPTGEVDHINGDRSDNRARNLRDVDRGENNKNKQIGIRNKSGALGLLLEENTGKYRVRITRDYKTIELGRYKDFEEAFSVRKAAEAALSFHQNHGRKAAA